MLVLPRSIRLAAVSILFSSFASAGEGPVVIFFGGSAAQKSVLDRCFPSFRNFGDPVTATQQAELIEELKRNPRQKYILAGHSHGSRFANDLASADGVPNRSRLTLVNLDGFAPRGVPSSVKRVCWNAATQNLNSRSRNYSSMSESNNCSEVHTHTASHCASASEWCLHFSLVNPATPANLKDWVQHGYDGCSEQSLEWLQLERSSSTRDASSRPAIR